MENVSLEVYAEALLDTVLERGRAISKIDSKAARDAQRIKEKAARERVRGKSKFTSKKGLLNYDLRDLDLDDIGI